MAEVRSFPAQTSWAFSFMQASASATGFKIAVATTPTLAKIIMTAEAATPDGATTAVQAIVDYRPDEANLANRVAINSLRVVD